MNSERDFQRYQEFMADKANRISGDIAQVAIASLTLGILSPSTSYETKVLNEAPVLEPQYQHKLGELTAHNVINVDFTPREALANAEAQLSAA